MDSRERDERSKDGRSERGEKIYEHEKEQHEDDDFKKDKKNENTEYISLAENYDPSDDSEFEPDPDDVNDELWDPEKDEEEE